MPLGQSRRRWFLVFLGLLGGLLVYLENGSEAAQRRANDYRVDPSKRRMVAYENLGQAMQLNLFVTQLIGRRDQNIQNMVRMLATSYRHQVEVIDQMQGLVRENREYKDPYVQQAIDLMYERGKGPTLAARIALSAKKPNFERALESLELARQTHNKVLSVLQALP
jgi:hypothetical protein